MHKGIWGSGGTAPPFMTLTLDGSRWLHLRHYRFTTGDTVPGTHWIGGWVGPELVWKPLTRETFLTPAGN
jgi:hypothetical protein